MSTFPPKWRARRFPVPWVVINCLADTPFPLPSVLVPSLLCFLTVKSDRQVSWNKPVCLLFTRPSFCAFFVTVLIFPRCFCALQSRRFSVKISVHHDFSTKNFNTFGFVSSSKTEKKGFGVKKEILDQQNVGKAVSLWKFLALDTRIAGTTKRIQETLPNGSNCFWQACGVC